MARMQDRELSTLAFHARVLAEAENPANPLLERVNFLGIAASGLQEFQCVRLGSLTAKLRRGDDMRPSGLMVSEVLEKAWKHVDEITNHLHKTLHEQLLPALEKQGVRILPRNAVTPVQMAALSTLFSRDVMPKLDVYLADGSRTAHRLPSGSRCLAVQLQDENQAEQLALVCLPDTLPGLIQLAGKDCYLTMEDAVQLNLHLLFNNNAIQGCAAFLLLRESHAACKAGEADVRQAVQACLAKRAKGKILRLICASEMPETMVNQLCGMLKAEPASVVVREMWLDPICVTRALVSLPGMNEHRYAPYAGHVPQELSGDLFAAIRVRDWLLCHPYDSFEPVLLLLEQAAQDSRVREIHMTLYRAGEDSRVIRAFRRAAQRGIKVHVCVEPRARMDEERNLRLMDVLEKAGCQVYSGLQGLKVHGKALMILREETGSIRRYVHLGTGNYNEATAAVYTDMGLMTADETVGGDAEALFRSLEGRAELTELQTLTAAPLGMRQELLRLIRREMDKARRGEKCGIACMMNALTDVEMISALTDAARCGVPVDLTVRGACCLIPGQMRETESVTVRSVVGRYLEHCRVFVFGGAGKEEAFIASADWMKRSLNRRVELLIPVKDPVCRRKLLHCLRVRQEPCARAWRKQGETYVQPGETENCDVQQRLMEHATSCWADA